jgi:hypothetical protein
MDRRIQSLLEESRRFRTTIVSEIYREIAEACGKYHPFTSLDPPDSHILELREHNGATRIGRNQYQHGTVVIPD